MKKVMAIFLAIVLVTLFAGCDAKNGKAGETMPGNATVNNDSWNELLLGYMLPVPQGGEIEIENNDSEWLVVSVENVDKSSFNSYIAACTEKGYSVDADREETYYEAFNAEGYRLWLDYDGDDDKLEIVLEEPRELGEFGWPTSGLAAKIPATPSNRGEVAWNDEEGFLAYIGDMDKEALSTYADSCKEAGFNVDYVKYDDYFEASNAEGDHLYISYEGAGVIQIDIEASEVAPAEQTEATSTEEATVGTQPTVSQNDEALGADFKEAMDSYEEFMDDYVEFMKKYNNNPGDITLLAEYAEFLSDYAKVCDDFAKWESADMNVAEAAYYLEVVTRVNQKLLEIAA